LWEKKLKKLNLTTQWFTRSIRAAIFVIKILIIIGAVFFKSICVV
jgi:hypothetical protein